MKSDPDLNSQQSNIVESKSLGLQFNLPYKFSVIKYDVDNGDVKREDKFGFKAYSLKEAYQKFQAVLKKANYYDRGGEKPED